jgi:hypothetical protein
MLHDPPSDAAAAGGHFQRAKFVNGIGRAFVCRHLRLDDRALKRIFVEQVLPILLIETLLFDKRECFDSPVCAALGSRILIVVGTAREDILRVMMIVQSDG